MKTTTQKLRLQKETMKTLTVKTGTKAGAVSTSNHNQTTRGSKTTLKVKTALKAGESGADMAPPPPTVDVAPPPPTYA
jgi:hypothetical protein